MITMTTSHIFQHHLPGFGWLDAENPPQPKGQIEDRAVDLYRKSQAAKKKVIKRTVWEEEVKVP
jgi:hypothetical protein